MSKYQSRTVECSVTVVGQGYNTGRNYDVVNYECFPTLGLLSRTHTHTYTHNKRQKGCHLQIPTVIRTHGIA